MIEIIKERRNDINRKVVCENCESELRFTVDDLIREELCIASKYDYLICPVCDYKLYVKKYEYFMGDYSLAYDISTRAEEIS